LFVQLSRGNSVVSLTGLLILATILPSAEAASADTIYLESNSTSGNSILEYRFNFTSSPILMSTTPAGGIGVFDPTMELYRGSAIGGTGMESHVSQHSVARVVKDC
jgi:hypothetical protein